MASIAGQLLAAAVALCAGAACDNPGIDEGPATLVLLETAPQDGAKGSTVAGPLRMTFNEVLARQSATAAAFKLTDAGGHAVSGTFEVGGKVLRFYPEQPLGLAERYEAVITRELRGYNGASLEADETWSFTTAAGKLGKAHKIGTIEGHAGGFQMSVYLDQRARAWAVWLEDVHLLGKQVKVAQPHAIVVAEQRPDGSWRRSHRFEAPSIEAALGFFCLVWDRRNNGHLVWQQRTPGGDLILLARFDADEQAWGAPQTVAKAAAKGLAHPRCALDPRVGLQIAWLQQDPGDKTNSAIKQRVFDVAQARWLEPAELLSSGKNGTLLAPVALQRAGQATRLFYATAHLSTVFLRVATLEAGEVRGDKLVSELAPSVAELALRDNQRGASFIFWKDTSDLSNTSYWALVQGAENEGWASPHKIVERPTSSAPERGQLAVDAAGDAFVSWREADGSDVKIYHAAYRRASKQWDAPALYQSVASGYHGSGITAARRPLMFGVSSQSANDSVWYVERPAPTRPWSSPAVLAKHAAGAAIFPASNVASMPSGRLAAFWYERKRKRRTVGGVVLSSTDLDLWGVLYQ